MALGVLVVVGDDGARAERPASVEGRYVYAGSVAATLEVRRDGDRHVVALTGGGRTDAGAAAPADCYVRASGTLRDAVLDAAFIAVDTETFVYSDSRARKERRRLRIVFRGGGARVTRADTDGYCGLGAVFVGSYRRVK
jgi:hypothetical protein